MGLAVDFDLVFSKYSKAGEEGLFRYILLNARVNEYFLLYMELLLL